MNSDRHSTLGINNGGSVINFESSNGLGMERRIQLFKKEYKEFQNL